MMRLKPAASSSLQKTYDECYFMCSTAVYFEGQNNEEEALKSWRSALEAVYYHNAYRVPATYIPKNETEKALKESIRDLELQCRERVDLLSALRESRNEAHDDGNGGSSSSSSSKRHSWKGKGSSNIATTSTATDNATAGFSSGWIGEGTVPAVDYTDLSKPSSSASPSSSTVRGYSAGSRTMRAYSNPNSSYSGVNSVSRGSSPERRVQLLTTLRGNNSNSNNNNNNNNNIIKDSALTPGGFGSYTRQMDSPTKKLDLRPTASKAAGMAWDSLYRYPSSEKATNDSGASSVYSVSSDPAERTRRNGLLDGPDDISCDGRGRQNPRVTRFGPTARTPSRQSYIYSDEPFSVSNTGLSGPSRSNASRRHSTKLESDSARSSYPPAVGGSSNHTSDFNSPATPKSNRRTRVSNSSRSSAITSSTPSSPPKTKKHHTSRSSTRREDDFSNHAVRKEASSPERRDYGRSRRKPYSKRRVTPSSSDQDSDHRSVTDGDEEADQEEDDEGSNTASILRKLPKGVDVAAARQILNDIVVKGEEVRWDDIAGLEAAKKALKEAVVYPFLRPDLFSGLREPTRGMLLFGPPGTGKTMLARAVASESKSTFFSVSSSTLTSKWHGDSEKLVRALFGLAKALAPSIIFVDEIDSLLSARSSGSENEASRRSKTEFLIQWSDLQRAAAGREHVDDDKSKVKGGATAAGGSGGSGGGGGDPSRVLVLAATNMPWDIDEAARRRFVRRQYIPLPEYHVREQQLHKLLSYQNHELENGHINQLVLATEGFSGSDITALAKDAAMGPLRNLGEALLHTPKDQVRPIHPQDFQASLSSIRPSVSREGLRAYEEWAEKFGERGG